jgi:hypothetical protein
MHSTIHYSVHSENFIFLKEEHLLNSYRGHYLYPSDTLNKLKLNWTVFKLKHKLILKVQA